MPGSANARQCLGRKLEWLGHRNVLIQTLKRKGATPIRIVLDDNMFDVKLRLGKLIRIFDSFCVVSADSGSGNNLVWSRIMLTTVRILRINGNRRA